MWNVHVAVVCFRKALVGWRQLLDLRFLFPIDKILSSRVGAYILNWKSPILIVCLKFSASTLTQLIVAASVCFDLKIFPENSICFHGWFVNNISVTNLYHRTTDNCTLTFTFAVTVTLSLVITGAVSHYTHSHLKFENQLIFICIIHYFLSSNALASLNANRKESRCM